MRLLLAFITILHLSSCRQDPSPPCDTISGEEYEVYAAVLDSLYLGQPNVLKWLPGAVHVDSVQARRFWPDGRVTLCVVRESTLVFERSPSLFDSWSIAFLRSDDSPAPKWIDWNALGKSFEGLRLCSARIHAEQLMISGQSSVVSNDSMNAIMSAGGDRWCAFYSHFPGAYGIIQFSRVGFNPERSQAVIYTEHQAASLAGVGEYWFLRRKRSRWILGFRFEKWVS